MPQLNPAPWFMILIFSWVVFLSIVPTKVLAHTSNNDPNPKSTKKSELNPWNWPWY
uniref:ATP synthase complex subunit 8 n=1 Tax=Pythonichthys microphthalmus TaxID=556145 RepID=D1YTC9_9TELE|nr:ATP synthase F0 subunit 8 [Pythonichthys microphthalmus]BAI53163.1 ATPase subunit 8 [Pythonichthys microphthalmus]